MSVFVNHMDDYLAAGLSPFPVLTSRKRPAVRGWQQATPRKTEAWRRSFPDADGIGILMGRASGITEVDIDAPGDAYIALAMETFGPSPIVIQTASGKSKIWYRHNGESRHIRPFAGMPIDLLGGGFSIAPPSRRDDLGTEYRFVQGGLWDLNRLPKMRSDVLPMSEVTGVRRGERNNAVFMFAMNEARHCDDVETLIDATASWATAIAEPLPKREVEDAARSAWKYQIAGRNFVGKKRPQICEDDRAQDELRDCPDAYFLLKLFQRFHSGRGSFAIAARAMSKAGLPPWHFTKIERARDVLVERGFLAVVRRNRQGGAAGSYRLMPLRVKQGERV